MLHNSPFKYETVNTLLMQNSEKVKSKMAEKLALYRRELTVQFDSLFPQELH
jgi:hypothetical protein